MSGLTSDGQEDRYMSQTTRKVEGKENPSGVNWRVELLHKVLMTNSGDSHMCFWDIREYSNPHNLNWKLTWNGQDDRCHRQQDGWKEKWT